MFVFSITLVDAPDYEPDTFNQCEATLVRRKKKSYDWMREVIDSNGASLWEN